MVILKSHLQLILFILTPLPILSIFLERFHLLWTMSSSRCGPYCKTFRPSISWNFTFIDINTPIPASYKSSSKQHNLLRTLIWLSPDLGGIWSAWYENPDYLFLPIFHHRHHLILIDSSCIRWNCYYLNYYWYRVVIFRGSTLTDVCFRKNLQLPTFPSSLDSGNDVKSSAVAVVFSQQFFIT